LKPSSFTSTTWSSGLIGSGPVARRYSKAPIPADMPSDSTSWPDETGLLNDNNSHYESHRREIAAAFKQCNGNLSATERLLRGQGIRCGRRWIGVFAAKWGLR
jgi:hypothetical protein